MQCERFKKLLKSWYVQIQNEALAPARMVTFMEKHLDECKTCMFDPEARQDVKKIITLVLPQDKLKVPSRSNRKANMPLGGPGLPDPPEPIEGTSNTEEQHDDNKDNAADVEIDDELNADTDTELEVSDI